MTLQEIKDGIETISLDIESIQSFDYGEDFLIATRTDSVYPMVFLEIPYALNYDLTTFRFKTVQFALNVFFKSDSEKKNDHELISKAETIGDYLLKQIRETYGNEFTITSANAVSVRNFSDDVVCGVRIDITGRTARICNLDC